MRYAYYTLAFLVVLLVSVMGFRGLPSTLPPIEVFPDMDHQAKYKPQAESKFFGGLRYNQETLEVHYAGKNPDGSFVRGFPADLAVNEALVRRGQNRFEIYCLPCHGKLGDGQGITKSYGMATTPSYHDDRIRSMPEGEIFNTITNGKNTMFPYADKLSPDDRWAVVAYVRALQRAHHASIDDVPPDQRGGLK